MPKPIVAYVESSMDYSDDNPWRDALSYMLREHRGCEVIVYENEYEFKDDLRRLKKLASWNMLVLVIVRQERYSESQHKSVIRLVRSRLSLTTPIVVLPAYDPENPFQPNPAHSIYGFDHDDAGLQDLAKKVVADWKSPDWLGAETPQDQAVLKEQLRHAYEVHYLQDEDDGMLGTPDPNHQVVAEALRLRLLPAMFLKEEFDDTLKTGPQSFASAAPSLYEKEVERLKTMSDEERRRVEDRMLAAAGITRAEGGGFFKMRASLGDNISGFAIDPLTGETTVTTRFGLHHYAADQLRNRIERIEEMRGNEDSDEHWRSRIVSGLIYRDIDGFSLPFLQLNPGFSEDEHFEKAVQMIYKRKAFIPVTHDAHLLIPSR